MPRRPSIDAIVKLSKSIDGWLTDKEVAFLYLAARKLSPRGHVVEIGSWKGRSTVCLALGSMHSKGKKIFTVDPHIGSREEKSSYTLPEFRRNLRRHSVARYVKALVMKSEEAAWKWRSGKISFLWIDGSHEYKDVRKDFLLWEKYLIDGGVIAFHDSFYGGPSRVIENYIMRSGKFSGIGHVDYITFARKKNQMTIFNSLRAFCFRHFLRNIMRTEEYQPMIFRKLIKRVFLSDFKKTESF